MKFAGWVNQQKTLEYYSKSDIFCFPSIREFGGAVVLEAMACGLPVIVTSQCGSADVVDEGVNGFVVPPRDIEAITNKLVFLAENEAKRVEMGKAARITAEQQTPEIYQQTLNQIFAEQLSLN